MATMFKKSKRNFRKKVLHEDDETGNENETENVPVISKSVVENSKAKEKGKSKNKVDKVASSNSLLSFDDEVGDDTEVFKVRKSKESRRLAKKIEQERKRKEKTSEEVNAKKIDEVQDDTDEKLAALRAELSQITGEGVDDDDEDVDNDLDSVGIGSVKEPVSNSSVRTDFSIPDAAAIHAARKRRELARQTEQDFIPVDDTKRYEGHFTSTGRLAIQSWKSSFP